MLTGGLPDQVPPGDALPGETLTEALPGEALPAEAVAPADQTLLDQALPGEAMPPEAAALAERSDAVCRMGAMILATGTASYRVKRAMGRVAEALDIDTLEAQVTLNEIVVTTRRHGFSRTRVVEVSTPLVNADRICELMRISLRAQPGLSPEELHHQLDAVEHKPHLYPLPMVCTAAALACAAFAFLNQGAWPDCLVAALGAAIGKGVQVWLRRFRVNQLVVVALASAAACCAAAAAGTAARLFLVPGYSLHQVAVIASTLFLVPGFPLLAAALDLARFDFAAGMSRLLFAGLVTVAGAAGICPVTWMLALPFADGGRSHLAAGLLLVLRALASFAGVLGFALTFNTPLRVALATACIGTLGNLLRLSAIDLGGSTLPCAAAATLLIGLLVGSVNRRLLAARITLSVPAVLIMIPGMTAYRSILSSVADRPLDALAYGMTSVSAVCALTAGLIVARMITDPVWAESLQVWTHPPHTYTADRLREEH